MNNFLKLLVVAGAAFTQGPPVEESPSSAAGPTGPVPLKQEPEPSPSEMTNAQLIARLPPARQEMTFNDKTDDWEKNKISEEWARRVAAGAVSSEELGAAVRQCGALRSSPTYCKGEVYHVWLRVPEWLPKGVITATTQSPVGGKAEARSYVYFGCGNAIAWDESKESFQPIGKLSENAKDVVFDVEVVGPPQVKVGALKWSGKIVLPVNQVTEVTAKPVDSPELAQAVQRTLRLYCDGGRFPDGPSAWFGSRPVRPLSGDLASTLMQARLELLRDGVVVAAQFIEDPDEAYGEEKWGGTFFISGEVAEQILTRQGIERFRVRVRGVAPTLPSQWYRIRYWSGQYTVPLSELLGPAKATP